MVEELYGTWYQSGSFSLINVGSGFHCLRSFFLFLSFFIFSFSALFVHTQRASFKTVYVPHLKVFSGFALVYVTPHFMDPLPNCVVQSNPLHTQKSDCTWLAKSPRLLHKNIMAVVKNMVFCSEERLSNLQPGQCLQGSKLQQHGAAPSSMQSPPAGLLDTPAAPLGAWRLKAL